MLMNNSAISLQREIYLKDFKMLSLFIQKLKADGLKLTAG